MRWKPVPSESSSLGPALPQPMLSGVLTCPAQGDELEDGKEEGQLGAGMCLRGEVGGGAGPVRFPNLSRLNFLRQDGLEYRPGYIYFNT